MPTSVIEDVVLSVCKEGFATPRVAYGAAATSWDIVCSRGIASRRRGFDGRVGVLTFSMLLAVGVDGFEVSTQRLRKSAEVVG